MRMIVVRDSGCRMRDAEFGIPDAECGMRDASLQMRWRKRLACAILLVY